MAQMTKTEIVNETVAFYSANPNKLRSLNEYNDCVFNGPNGTHCAIGRCLLPELKEQGALLDGNTKNISVVWEALGKSGLDDILEERYRGHELLFWYELQRLHDGKIHWDESGITYEGELKTNEILSKNYSNETN